MGKLAAAAVVMLVSAVAFAQTPPPTPERHQRVTELVLDEGDVIEGDVTRPDVEYINASERVKHSSLIRIREDFRDRAFEAMPRR
jgi:hypothetical protein